jgi:TM2 domain-containing membrane protein YozV
MESILGSGEAVVPAPLQPAAEAERKRPGVAFLLSLILPGAGHIYCGKRTAGIATSIFFLVAAALAIALPPTNPFWGVGFRGGLVLYAFAFLDAFYTAREINAGMAQYMVGNNPRIAAMLNLLTNGFGYFYLGERKKGIVVFLVLRVFASIAQSAKGSERMPMLVILEVVLAILAADAYRLARKQLHEAFPDVTLDPFTTQEGMSALVPAALAGLCVFNYAALVVIGLALPDYRNINQSASSLTKDGETTSYTNPRYGVSIVFPADWVAETGNEANHFASAKRFNGGCSVYFIAEAKLPIVTAEIYTAALKKQLETNPLGFKWLSEKPAVLGGMAGREETFIAKVKETDVRQNYVVAPSGLTMYALVETVGTPLMDECSADFQSIRNSVRLK